MLFVVNSGLFYGAQITQNCASISPEKIAKLQMIAPFSTVNTNTGSYSGSQFYLGYMDDYGALRMTTLNCSGECRLQAVEAKK